MRKHLIAILKGKMCRYTAGAQRRHMITVRSESHNCAAAKDLVSASAPDPLVTTTIISQTLSHQARMTFL